MCRDKHGRYRHQGRSAESVSWNVLVALGVRDRRGNYRVSAPENAIRVPAKTAAAWNSGHREARRKDVFGVLGRLELFLMDFLCPSEIFLRESLLGRREAGGGCCVRVAQVAYDAELPLKDGAAAAT